MKEYTAIEQVCIEDIPVYVDPEKTKSTSCVYINSHISLCNGYSDGSQWIIDGIYQNVDDAKRQMLELMIGYSTNIDNEIAVYEDYISCAHVADGIRYSKEFTIEKHYVL